jgi:TatD DNase family protein
VIEYFDSHCHLTDTAFRDDREAVLRRAWDLGVRRMVTIASTLDDAAAALGLVRPAQAVRPSLWATAGVHPHEAGSAPQDAQERIREMASQHARIVAIGETGLDYHYDHAPRAIQRDLFAAHLEVAAERGLPAVVHLREADADLAAILGDMPRGTTGVLHCFTGGVRSFEAAREADWYVSFSGIASFRSFDVADLLREVPRDRLLIETDAPYLSPEPKRGRRNEPAHLPWVAEAVARHLDEAPETIAQDTTENACRFYGVS